MSKQLLLLLTRTYLPKLKIEDPRSVADDPFGETDCSTHEIDIDLLYFEERNLK